MVVLDMGLNFALKTVGINGLGLVAVWIVAVGYWTSVYVFGLLSDKIETVVATKSGCNRPGIIFLVL